MYEKQVNFLQQQTEKIKSPTPRWLFFLIIIFLLLITGCVSKSILKEKAPNDPSAYDPITLEPKKPEGFFNKLKSLILTENNELIGYKDDRINILILGMGGAGHDGPFLADTLIIASIKPSTGEIALISIPRDLLIEIPNKGMYKINYANAFGEVKQ